MFSYRVPQLDGHWTPADDSLEVSQVANGAPVPHFVPPRTSASLSPGNAGLEVESCRSSAAIDNLGPTRSRYEYGIVSPARTSLSLSPAEYGLCSPSPAYAAYVDGAAPSATAAVSPTSTSLAPSVLAPPASGSGDTAVPTHALAWEAIPTSAFLRPPKWAAHFDTVRQTMYKRSDHIAVTHDATSALKIALPFRTACCVRTLPELTAVQEALKAVSGKGANAAASYADPYSPSRYLGGSGGGTGAANNKGRSFTVTSTTSKWSETLSGFSAFDMSRSASMAYSSYTGAAFSNAALAGPPALPVPLLPNPAVWAVSETGVNEIVVHDAFTGERLMSIRDPKNNVPVSTLLHAPFRGFIDRKLRVVPVRKPKDLLRLKQANMLYTDYVWVGFTDGSIRLFPANPRKVAETDRAAQMSRGELADIVFELPKYHAGSVVSIARSPCHRDDDGGVDLSRVNRLSTAIEYMTAAATRDTVDPQNREHLSLMCSASVDSCVVVWDIRKIYEAMETLRRQATSSSAAHGDNTFGSSRRSVHHARDTVSDTIFLDGSVDGGSTNFSVRTTCSLLKVRPLMRLKGDVAGLRTLRWVSTLVTTAGYEGRRDAAALARDPHERSAPEEVRNRRLTQTFTRFERREEQRHILQVDEDDMREVEAELERLLPPLAPEAVQEKRINLLLAGDEVGTVHLWNLDEELAQCTETETPPLIIDVTPSRKASVTDTSVSSVSAYSPSASHQPQHSSDCVINQNHSSLVTPQRGTSVISVNTLTSPTSVAPAAAATPGAKSTVKSTAKKRKLTTKMSTIAGVVSATPQRSPGGAAAGSARVDHHSLTASTMKTPGKSSRLGALDVNTSASPAGGVTAATKSKKISSSTTILVPRPSGSARPSKQRGGETASARASGRVSGTRSPSRASTSASPCRPSQGGRRTISYTTPAKSTNAPKTPMRASTSTMRGPSVASSVSCAMSPSTTTKKKKKAARASQGGGGETGATPSTKSAKKTRKSNAVVVLTPAGGAPGAVGSPSAGTALGTETRFNRYIDSQSLVRSAKCKIEFTRGMAVNGMAVSLPSTIVTTMRRVRDPKVRHVSLLEEPTPEEIEQRTLENSFEELTDEKALYFAFQQMQLYVAVDGTILNMQFLVDWQRPDSDGRELFRQRERETAQRAARRFRKQQEYLHEVTSVHGSVSFSGFSAQLKKLVLEAHSQPVTRLFFDGGRRHLWAARNDGLMSLFSVDSNKVVTRIANPAATTALGPPKMSEWRKEQKEFMRKSGGQLVASRHLERHRETDGYAEDFFHTIVPFCTRTQSALLLCHTQPARHSTYGGSGNLCESFRGSYGRGGVSFPGVYSPPRVSAAATEQEDGYLNNFLLSPTNDADNDGGDNGDCVCAHGTQMIKSQREEPDGMGENEANVRNSVHLRLDNDGADQHPRLSVGTCPLFMETGRGSVSAARASILTAGDSSPWFNSHNNGNTTAMAAAAASSALSPPLMNSAASRLDGRSEMSHNARKRELHLTHFVQNMESCRIRADGVRKAQKHKYRAECDAIANRVRFVIGEIGSYSHLLTLHEYFDLWRRHVTEFPRLHIVRTQRTQRLNQTQALADSLNHACRRRLLSRYYVSWFRRVCEATQEKQGECLKRLATGDATRPTAHMMTFLSNHRRLEDYFHDWRRWAQERAEEREGRHCGDNASSDLDGPVAVSGAASPAGVSAGSPRESSPFHRLNTCRYVRHASAAAGFDATTRHRRDSLGISQVSAPPGELPLNGGVRPSSPPLPPMAPPARADRDLPRDADDTDDDDEPAACAPPLTPVGRAAVRGRSLVQASPDRPDFFPRVLSMLTALLDNRVAIVKFRDDVGGDDSGADSVLDESWLSMVEGAEAGVPESSWAARRLNVFSVGLLPLLQGLLSTADDVLPNLGDVSVAQEVVSMLAGILLCLDYVVADAYEFLPRFHDPSAWRAGSSRSRSRSQGKAPSPEQNGMEEHVMDVCDDELPVDPMLFLMDTRVAAEALAAKFAARSLQDEDSYAAMEMISNLEDSFYAFLDFIVDEQS